MKKILTSLILLTVLTFTLRSAELKSGTTFKATDRTWTSFSKYCSTTTGKADETAQEIYRSGREGAFSSYTKILTFYADGTLLVSNTAYTEIYVIPYLVSEGRIMIPRSSSNSVFGTQYPITAGADIDYIHFGYISEDGMSLSTNPNIIKYGNYFMLYR